MSEWVVCKLCIFHHGLKGSDLVEKKCPYAFKTQDELIKHLKEVHNINTVDNKGERNE